MDYNGTQYWSGVVNVIAHEETNVELPLEQLALNLTNDPNPVRFDGTPPVFSPEEIKVASIGSLWGMLANSVVANTASPEVYYYHNDHLGTPQKITDENGAVVWSADYKPFGEAAISVNTMENNLRFPGQYYDEETGLHYNYHRYYDLRTGRYLKPDPTHSIQPDATGIPYLLPVLLLEPQELNLYHYVQNNPIRYTDPSGLRVGQKIITNIIPEISNILINKTLGALTGAECASIYYRRNCAVPSKNDAWAECMTIFYTRGIPGGLYGSDDIVSECADECYRITHSKKYKELCSNDCEN